MGQQGMVKTHPAAKDSVVKNPASKDFVVKNSARKDLVTIKRALLRSTICDV